MHKEGCPTLMRNPASCGGQILSDLAFATKAWLCDNLKGTYKYWDSRVSAKEGYKEDGVFYSYSIFKGETIIFSDKDESDSFGNKLELLIQEWDLGKLVSQKAKNPNTGNPIRTWIWVYNGKKIPPAPKPKAIPK